MGLTIIIKRRFGSSNCHCDEPKPWV